MRKQINDVGLLIQTMLSFSIIVFGILAIFVEDFLIATQSLLTINMFMVAYNNHKASRQKIFTYSYIFMGIVSGLTTILLMVK